MTSKSKWIKVLVKNPERRAEVQEIKDELDILQGMVGGYIETIKVAPGIIMIVNEEGKLRNLPPNFALGNDLIVGSAVFIGKDGEEFAGLTEQGIQTAREIIRGPQHDLDRKMKKFDDFIHQAPERHGGDE